MVALETLFIRDRSVKNKGESIALRISELMNFRDMSPDQQAKWLQELYQRRNDAVHEAREYSEDYHVDRLAVLTLGAVRWAASHTTVRAVCATFDEVHDNSHP